MKTRIGILICFILASMAAIQVTPKQVAATGNNCQKDVPIFTTDTAPSDGILIFKVQLGAEDPRRYTSLIKMWDVKEGEQIEDVVPNVSAPRWGRLWWFSYESGLMFLPSQYWHGKGDASDLYGISCGPDDQPSYHSAFYSAIPETELPTSQPCSTPPRLITPVDGAAVHSLSPHFEVDFSNEPHAVIFRINYSTIDSGTEGSSRVFVDFFTPLERLNFPIPYNLDPTVTYRWYATYVCSDGSEMSSEEWTFTTEIL